MRPFQTILADIALLCVPACQQAYQPTAETPVALRPIKSRDVFFKRSYYSWDQVDQPPVIIQAPPPRYPTELRKAGISGNIQLAIAVDEKGDVSEVETPSATDERFDASAKEAILQWKFKPARKDGKAVAVWRVFPIKFSYH